MKNVKWVLMLLVAMYTFSGCEEESCYDLGICPDPETADSTDIIIYPPIDSTDIVIVEPPIEPIDSTIIIEPMDSTIIIEPIDSTIILEPMDSTIVIEPVDSTGQRRW